MDIAKIIFTMLFSMIISISQVTNSALKNHQKPMTYANFEEPYKVDTYEYPYEFSLVNSEEEVETQMAIKDKDKNNRLYPYSYSQYTGTEQEAYIAIYNGIYDMQSKIDVSSYNITAEKCFEMIVLMWLDNPDFYYISLDMTYEYDNLNATVINMNYKYTKEQVTLWSDKLKDIANSIKSQVSDNISLYDLYLYLHDFVIVNAEYNEGTSSQFDNNVVGALINKKCTCAGFAQAFLYLCREFDICSTIKTGAVGDLHMWNCVPYGDEWVNIDVGMDNVDSEYKNWAPHNQFGISDELAIEYFKHAINTGAITDYKIAPECRGTARLFEMLPDKYTYNIDNYDRKTIIDEIINLAIENINDNKYYIEIECRRASIYYELTTNYLKPSGAYMRNIIQEINKQCDTKINTEQVGVVFLEWDYSLLIYFIKQE